MVYRRLILILLASLCLTADAGITVLKTRCTHSGKISYGFFTKNHCCKEIGPDVLHNECSIRKTSCCEFRTIKIKCDFNRVNTESNQILSLPLLTILPASQSYKFELVATNSKNTFPPNPPPSCNSTDLLLATRCFRI